MKKSLIFELAALICIQTVHAIVLNRCELELDKLRKEAAKFFTEFQTDYDILCQDLFIIQDSSNSFNYALESFEDIDFGIRLDQSLVKCLLKKFFVIFYEERKEIFRILVDFQNEIEILLEMADTFSNELNLRCMRSRFRGCLDDLNQLRCQLIDFFKGLKRDGRQAEVNLRAIDDTCYDLGKIARKFTARNYLTCKNDTDGLLYGRINEEFIQLDISNMFPDFKEKHDDGRYQLDDLSDICGKLSADIEMWRTKLAED